MFDDEPKKSEDKKEKVEVTIPTDNKSDGKKDTAIGSLDDMFVDDIVQDKPTNESVQEQDDEDTYDLQKELEAKFDELFGPMDA